MPMERGLFSRLPADLWYLVLRHLCQKDVLTLAATCHETAEVFRNPQVPVWHTLYAGCTRDWEDGTLDWRRLAPYVEQRRMGVKRLALSLNLEDTDVTPRSPHTRHRVAGVNDHYHILHRGLPWLLAACPNLRLHLRIYGRNPFVPCSFHSAQDLPAAAVLDRPLHFSSEDSMTAIRQLHIEPVSIRDNISPSQFEMLCELTSLRHLTVAAETDNGTHYEVEGGYQHDAEGIRLAGLPAIPPAVSQLQALRSLRLWQHEALRTLPPELFRLSRLTLLDISETHVSELPKSLRRLTALRHFQKCASSCHPDLAVGAALMPLACLTYLSLRGSKLIRDAAKPKLQLPPSLQHLNLRDCWLGQLQLQPLLALTCLNFAWQRLHGIAALPEALTTMTSLRKLLLAGNNLRDLGSTGYHRGWLGHLTELDLSYNLLTAVPPVLDAATALQQLHLQHQMWCRSASFDSKFEVASLAVLHGVITLTLLDLDQMFCRVGEGRRPQPPPTLVAAVADLQQYNPTLKVELYYRPSRVFRVAPEWRAPRRADSWCEADDSADEDDHTGLLD